MTEIPSSNNGCHRTKTFSDKSIKKIQIRMAKIDKLKEEIGWLKIIFAILIAADISLGAWVVQNYGKTSKILLIVSVIGVFLLTFIIVWVNQVAYRKIDELEEL